MDQIRRDLAEQNDRQAEEQVARQIRELEDSASGKLDEAISNAGTQHLVTLQRIQNEQEKFKNQVDELKEKDKRDHEAKVEELLRRSQEHQANITIRCDTVTRVALDNLEKATEAMKDKSAEIEKQIVEAKAKSAEIEVNVSKQVFDEVQAQEDKDEYLTEKRHKEINNQHAAIQKEEEAILAAERAEKKKNAGKTIAEMRSDLVDRQKIGMMNLAIQHSANERNSRSQINAKIMEVKSFTDELNQRFARAYIVLNATPENYKKVKASKKRATKSELARFSEILTAISSKLNDIEQNLASFEWDDVQMTTTSRQIKTQISSFCKIIANLILILDLDDVDIDPATTEKFSEAKDVLFEQINNMSVISEKRDDIVQAIQQRMEETMPNVAALAIEN